MLAIAQPQISRHSKGSNTASARQLPWQTGPGRYPKKMSSTIIGIPGLKLPDTWELERLQSGNPARLVQTQAQSALALLKASAAINIVTCMLRERDRASVPRPDAVSTTANECSQVPAPPPPGTGVLSPACASPSAAAASSTAHSFTCADQSTMNPVVHLASGGVLGLTFSRFPAALPGVHSPAHMSPSAAVAGSAVPSFTHADRSTAYPLAYPPSGAAPGYAFSLLSTAPLGYALAPPSAAFPELAYTGNNSQTSFQAEIMPGNAPAHTHFFLGSHLT